MYDMSVITLFFGDFRPGGAKSPGSYDITHRISDFTELKGKRAPMYNIEAAVSNFSN